MLHRGSGGVFDVVVDGERIYSKHETGSFPDPEDILDDLADREDAAPSK